MSIFDFKDFFFAFFTVNSPTDPEAKPYENRLYRPRDGCVDHRVQPEADR